MAASAETAAARLLRRLQALGAPFARLVLTRNRRVMVSLGERGRTLRLHEVFLDAPPEVLAAVPRLFGARQSRERTGARAAIQLFLRRALPAVPPARAPRRRRVTPTDRPHLQRLAAEFERVNREHFAGALPAVPLHLSARMQRRNGHFAAHPPEIVIARRLCTHALAGEAEQTLRHEMIHLWQHHTGRKLDHGAEFRAWARRLDVHPRAVRAVLWK